MSLTKKEYASRLESARIAGAICTYCGKAPIDSENSRRACAACLELRRQRDRMRQADGRKVGTSPWAQRDFKQKAIENGFCIVHTSRKRDGKSKAHCNECLARLAANQAKYRARKAQENGKQIAVVPPGVKAGNGRQGVIKVTEESSGWFRARVGRIAWWGKTAEEAKARLMRDLEKRSFNSGEFATRSAA